MASPLTESSSITCVHSGKVTGTGAPKLTIGGQAVLLADGVMGKTVDGCTNLPPPPSKVPCGAVASLLPPSLAQKLTVGGRPVVLDTLQGTTACAPPVPPPGPLSATAGQSKLTTI